MLKPHELEQATTLRSQLEPHKLTDLEEDGPYGRTLGAIRLYRNLAHDVVVDDR